VVKHFVPDSLLRTSSLRGLGSYANVFAIESFMDELAHAAGVDPIEFRLRHLEDERARAVIEAVAENAHWRKDKKARSDEKGQGFAFAQYKNRQSYVAVIVDLSVNPASGQISLARATLAADSGQIVNPEAVSSQLEGVFVQAASWTLKEQVSFDRHGIISVDWHSYPILRFRDAPKIDVVLLNQPGQPYLGVGEGAQGPVPAAIANAIFDAVGIRLRKIPFTPARVQEALNSLAGPRPDKE
jgi:CO/xanthine dehydrogenase Mo-binding subunit